MFNVGDRVRENLCVVGGHTVKEVGKLAGGAQLIKFHNQGAWYPASDYKLIEDTVDVTIRVPKELFREVSTYEAVVPTAFLGYPVVQYADSGCENE